MKKYLINDDDTVRIGQTIFKIDQTKPYSNFLSRELASKNYESRLLDAGINAEIFQDGNDHSTTTLMQGDIIASKHDPEMEYIIISNQLMPLYEAKPALNAYNKHDTKIVKLPSPRPSVKEEHEYDKRDKQMSRDISNLKKLVECGESQTCTIIDGVSYGASHTWYEVAQIALDLAEQQEWFDRYEDKYEN